MEQITLRLPVRTLAEIERDARDAGRSRSEHMRDILDSHRDTQQDVAEYEREIVELRDRVDYLENRERVILDEREEKAELVRYVEDERTAAERWRQASLLTKAKWAVTGMPDEGD